MKITYLGHATILLEMQGYTIVVDPFVSANELAKYINIDSLKVDFMLITHGHQDHVLDIERIAKNNPDVLLISNYEIATYFAGKGLKTHPMNHGGKRTFDFGTIKYVNAVHSSVLPDGTYGGNPGGFVVWDDMKCIYLAGDTALTYDMKLIPLTCPKVDIMVLPIGDNFTMGYEDAVLACDFVECSKVIGCHYDTFPVIGLDAGKAQALFASNSCELLLPEIGKAIELN